MRQKGIKRFQKLENLNFGFLMEHISKEVVY